MAGIYFHIPYCRSKCHYCDFYESNNIKTVTQLVNSEIEELHLRKKYIDNQVVETIYFGGGTPSILSIEQLNNLLSEVFSTYTVTDTCEITMEANPEDLTYDYLKDLSTTRINRLSIGIQSFNDDTLLFLGRRHGTQILQEMIKNAQNLGFSNISLDLIYGIPGMSYDNYINSVKAVLNLNVQHISAYALTIEKNTYFYKLLKTNRLTEVVDDVVISHFNSTIDLLADNGYNHYEVSSFAKDGYRSKHNSSYWNDKIYLGIGPSAHSYNGVSRQWNINSTKNYCLKLANGDVFYEVEQLTEIDKYNEYVLLKLRTSEGLSKGYISNHFNNKIVSYFLDEVFRLSNEQYMINSGDNLMLTRKGILISDFIIRKLFYV